MFKQITFAAILASVSCAAAQTIAMVNVPATLEKGIDAKKAKAGDPFTAKVSGSTQLSDGTKVPSGSVLEGHIDSVTPSEKKSDSTMTVTIDKLQIKNGNEVGIKATLVSVMTTAPRDEDKPYDPSGYHAGTAGDNKANGQNNRDAGFSSAPHPIDGLTVAGSPQEPTSGTFTQAKSNVRLSGGVQLVVSVALAPAASNPH
jgi:hypothetical protein